MLFLNSKINAINNTSTNIIIKNPNKANRIANGNQNKQKHHHQEMLIIPVSFSIHNKTVTNSGHPLIFNVILLSFIICFGVFDD